VCAYDPESMEQAQPLMLDANNHILKTTKKMADLSSRAAIF
jgi:hypothetical protein